MFSLNPITHHFSNLKAHFQRPIRLNSTQLARAFLTSSEHFGCSSVELSYTCVHSARSDSTQLNREAFSRDPVLYFGAYILYRPIV